MKYAAPPCLQSCEMGSQYRGVERRLCVGGRCAVSEIRSGLEKTGAAQWMVR
jgi:hypothetical protein